MEWYDSSMESVDTLREETEERPELWEVKPCCQGLECIPLRLVEGIYGPLLLFLVTSQCKSFALHCRAGLASLLS